MIRAIPFLIRDFDLTEVFTKAVRTMNLWQSRAEQRYRLRSLDGYALRDMGITKAQAVAESKKPFWWY